MSPMAPLGAGSTRTRLTATSEKGSQQRKRKDSAGPDVRKDPLQEKEILRKAAVGSTDRSNTIGFWCCPDQRCKSGSYSRIIRDRQDGIVRQVEGWRIYHRHRLDTTEASQLRSRDAQSHRRNLSA